MGAWPRRPIGCSGCRCTSRAPSASRFEAGFAFALRTMNFARADVVRGQSVARDGEEVDTGSSILTIGNRISERGFVVQRPVAILYASGNWTGEAWKSDSINLRNRQYASAAGT